MEQATSDVEHVVSKFGRTATAALSNPAVEGQPEDQLRVPLVNLLHEVGALSGFDGVMGVVGETSIAELRVRPDFAVTVRGALVGHVEVKAPEKGADPRRFTVRHDREQWAKLRALPNLVYTDGNAFSLWRDGEIVGDVVHLGGDVRTDGEAVSAPPALLALLRDFLGWTPQPPRSVAQLAAVSARLCRLLRDEVEEQVGRGNGALTHLAEGWRRLLFPDATDDEFADGYAQAVTFGLLLARARDIEFGDDLGVVARALRDRNSLIGSALGLLTDEAADLSALDTSLDTMRRVLGVVDWGLLVSRAEARKEPGERAEPWLYFYEDFLAEYDNALRKETGSYYTPPEVVREMVRLVDDVLQSPARFGLPRGLADDGVTVADPAVGAGTFLLAVLRRIAATLDDDEGPGAMRKAIPAAVRRLVGFEVQFGPFAVAQLRLTGEVADLVTPPTDEHGAAPPEALPDLRLFVTDTLGNPFAGKEDAWVDARLRPIAESRLRADEVKRRAPITVVIGNPPYRERAKGMGGWIETGDKKGAAPLDAWQPPAAWGAGAHAKHLRNLYVYFWRWATWKVFGAGRALTQAEADAGHPREGVVCYITVAGFLAGPGFQKMRADLRRDCSEIWVVDCSPEGQQPPVASRVFGGVQQPVCIVLAVRAPDADDGTPARVRYTALPEGRREAKFRALAALALDGDGWHDAADAWRASFLPAATGAWAGYPALDSFFIYDGSGTKLGRTWPIAPDAETLAARWQRLTAERDPEAQEALFHPQRNGDRTVTKEETTGGIPGHESRSVPVAEDGGGVVRPTRYAFRSFDRQWIVPDKRLIDRENPTLWAGHSDRQVYLTAPADKSPTDGPAVSFAAVVPDMHHYNGRGGRVFPLWRDAEATAPNVRPALLAVLAEAYGRPVSVESVVAYLAAVLAHPAYVARFEGDLVQPGLRVPVTADADLFFEAAGRGGEVVWLHTFGERFAGAGRPPGPPRVEDGPRPRVPEGGEIPDDADALGYDAAHQRLTVGTGFVENVPPEVWAYEVSGKHVLTQWFSYRRRDRSRPIIGSRRPPSALNAVQPDGWLPEYTTELLNVLNVLARLVALEPAQADLLARICDGPTLDADALREAGAFDEAGRAGRGGRATDPAQGTLL